MAEPGAHPLKLASLLLQYPTPELWAARGELRAAVGALAAGRPRAALERFLDSLDGRQLGECQRDYVETFDFSRRTSLHLTYHRWGDLRQRGLALLRLKQRYADAGLELGNGELPDYLPVMLEFCALERERGLAAIDEHREALELVRASLRESGSPYAHLLDAVAAELPGLTRRQAARAARLAAEGPPSEEVGLEPFAPPEVMPAPGAEAIPGGVGRSG
ncbi:MAG TPA: nitrate reductase molybdenum cofactor assembly chaperone [Solirubrobacterales bacterium]|nr:nitrate reductase molybdenum cofactor assembly chaperone [Solirubrobacterales bacterium]